MLPTDANERKNIPVYSGFIRYFPNAIAEVAALSKEGNDQHNPGQPLHWDRSKSGDELDALARHLLDGAMSVQPIDEQIQHQRAIAWRAMAHLEKLCERRHIEQCDGPEYEYDPEDTGFTPDVHSYMRELRLKDD